jgi:two-component system chemotaxis response regulator CheB/chemosensory pili system protein ChpB (putative protein-glutamate methylesterase)
MVDARPAVALLFDDAELGGQLRLVLQELGAAIVHEGSAASLDGELLRQLDPDVLVVNLDDNDDAAFDRLYAVIGGERPRLVFNDASASRGLGGWDRARWARHLAAKVLVGVDVDPPRPPGALPVEVPVVAPAPAAEPGVPETAAAATATSAPEDAQGTPADAPDAMAPVDGDVADRQMAGEDVAPLERATTDDLEAELAALLDAPEGDFAQLGDSETAAARGNPVRLDDLNPELSGAWSELSVAAGAPAADAEAEAGPAPVDGAPAPIPPAAPEGWSLVDDTPPAADTARADAAQFGIQKLSAADFLAPDVAPVAADLEPTFSLELVSMEEAVAPTAWEPTEMLLDDLGAVPTRVVWLGAAPDGLASACRFLAGIPGTARHTLVLTQHYGERGEDEILQQLQAASALPVRLAANRARARGGEVMLVPAGNQLQLLRDGSIELKPGSGDTAAGMPTIDASFSMAASVFGRDALGIVFAGRATDAVAGAQAIHDRGGQVWVESSAGDHLGDMVGAIYAEHLVGYSGTPQELAAHLIEVYP